MPDQGWRQDSALTSHCDSGPASIPIRP
jgi:hypothetical protein